MSVEDLFDGEIEISENDGDEYFFSDIIEEVGELGYYCRYSADVAIFHCTWRVILVFLWLNRQIRCRWYM